MSLSKFLNLIALCFSDGGIGFSSETMYIHFTNKSRVLLDLFENEIRKFSNHKIHTQIKPRGITLRVFDRDLVEELLEISPSYRTRPCNHPPFCPFFKGNTKYKFGKHNHISSSGFVYSEIVIPEELFQSDKDKAQFLKIYASCDGYASIFPRNSSWSAVERIIALVSHNPFVKQRLHELLTDLEIPHTLKPCSLEMRSKEAILQFKNKIGFVVGVRMTGNSKYWKDLDKNFVLQKIIRSYSINFESRDPGYIINKLINS